MLLKCPENLHHEEKEISIYIVRHGQSTWNCERRWTGHADPSLTAKGREQAKNACADFAAHDFQYVTSSELSRARETASIISEELNIELLEPVMDLNEIFSGDISGLTVFEIEEKYPGLMDQWRSGRLIDIPGGETWEAFGDRIFRGLNFLNKLSGNILVIAHGGVLRIIEERLGQPPLKHRNLEGIWVVL